MNTLLRLIEKQNIAASMLVVLAVLIFPIHTTQAETEAKDLVFDVSKEQLSQNMLSFQEVLESDHLVKSLQNYLEGKKSPLAPFAGEIIKLPQWEHALGIVFVESNFCRFAKNFNCGSLGVAPGHQKWRKYNNAYEGFADLTKLLEKPMYKDRLNTCAKKKGIYVVPGSTRWVSGCQKVQNEMEGLVVEAEQVKQELANQHLSKAPHPLLALAN